VRDPIDSKARKLDPAAMEDDLPRVRGDAASRLASEGLDSYSQGELMERIALLEAEIERVKAQHARAASHMKLADALFRPREPS
jgi:uncharacterized small protein (DUF1192 family)